MGIAINNFDQQEALKKLYELEEADDAAIVSLMRELGEELGKLNPNWNTVMSLLGAIYQAESGEITDVEKFAKKHHLPMSVLKDVFTKLQHMISMVINMINSVAFQKAKISEAQIPKNDPNNVFKKKD